MPAIDQRALALRAVLLTGTPGRSRSSSARRRGPRQQALDDLARRVLLAALRSRSSARRGRSGSRATCSPRSASRGMLEATPAVDVARRLRDARDDQRPRAPRTPGARLHVADAHLDGAEVEVRPHRPPHLRELDDRARPQQELDVIAVRAQPPKASGTPQRGKFRVKVCVRAECRPASRVRRGTASWPRPPAAAAAPAASGRTRAPRGRCRGSRRARAG